MLLAHTPILPLFFDTTGSLPRTTRSGVALQLMIPEADMNADQLEIRKAVETWRTARLLSREEADSQLEGEWLEAYNRFHEKYDADMELMLEIKEKVGRMIEPPKVEKKSIKQRKRDKWAKIQEREAAIKANAL